MKVRAGTLLQNGKYAIEAPLGQGYFGATYRATHAQLWQPVVVKTLSDSLLTRPEASDFVRQFVEQARILARCHHPNLPRVLDLFDEAGQPFLVLDYVPGVTLAQLAASDTPMPVERALHYTRQLASALDTLHQNGLLHRDVKPEHVVRYVGSDRVLLLEVGIARDLTVGAGQTHSQLLSPGYAAPEQHDGRPPSPATDVYALAATCYTLLSGEAPPAAPLRDRVPLGDLRRGRTAFEPAIELAVFAGLEPDPKYRPSSIAEWLSRLPDPQAAVPAVAAPAEPSAERPLLQRPWVPALFATTSVLAAVGGAGLVMSLQSGAGDRSDSPPSQLLRSTPSPRRPALPDRRPADNAPTSPEADNWTQRESDPDDYTRSFPDNADASAPPSRPDYSGRSQFVPVQSGAEPEMSGADPVLSDEPFTDADPDAPPLWSEPVPESLERPSNGMRPPNPDGDELYDAYPGETDGRYNDIAPNRDREAKQAPGDRLPNRSRKQELEPFKDLSAAS